MERATYRYYADWNRDGDYSDDYENITEYVLSASWEYGVDINTNRSKIGIMRLILDNSSAIFSSFNDASSLYGLILPAVPIKITMQIAGGAETTMFIAYLQSIIPIVGPNTAVSTAELIAYGPLSLISDTVAHLALQENKQTGTLVNLLLDNAGFPVSSSPSPSASVSPTPSSSVSASISPSLSASPSSTPSLSESPSLSASASSTPSSSESSSESPSASSSESASESSSASAS